MKINACSMIVLVCVTAATAMAETPTIEQCKENIDAMIDRMNEDATLGPCRPNWVSLKKQNAEPEWFLDGKIGIYFTWGLFTVPAYGSEWYARWMHLKPGEDRLSFYDHHRETWGEPDEFGYHEFAPMFKPTKFDPEDWAKLFVAAGARWAGPLCEHHDGYAMWDSELTPWNAMDAGPGRDLVGELEKAIKGEGLKFVTTFHHERTQSWFPRVEGWPTTSDDPVLQFMYMNIPEYQFNKIYQAKIGEVIYKYQPDMIWFDGRVSDVPEPHHLNFLACYFNQAHEWGKEVMVTTKKLEYPQEVSVMDFEKGRTAELTAYPWLSDDTISTRSWSYLDSDFYLKPVKVVLNDFIDTVSKNGHLLLNVSPRSDGIIPDDQRQILLTIGDWLKRNGEAIYSTRPWLEYGEGPAKMKQGGSHLKKFMAYTEKDIRYTGSKDGEELYVTVMGTPSGTVEPAILQVNDASGGQVELLSPKQNLTFEVKDKALVIHVPDNLPEDHAYAFKLTGFDVGLTPKAQQRRNEAIEAVDIKNIRFRKLHPNDIHFGQCKENRLNQ